MKKLLIILIGSFTLSAAAPALAGPDWQIIEKARKDGYPDLTVFEGSEPA